MSVAVCGGLFSIYMLPLLLASAFFSKSPKRHANKARTRYKSHASSSLGSESELPHRYSSTKFMQSLTSPHSIGLIHVWCAFQLVVYFMIRLLWPLLGFTCREKSTATHLNDITGMIIRGFTSKYFSCLIKYEISEIVVVSTFGNISQRLAPLQTHGISFFGKVVFYLLIYSLMYETCPRASVGNVEIPSTAAIILNLFVLGLIVMSVYSHIKSAAKCGTWFLRVYIGWMIIIVLYIGVAYFIPSVRLHLHHYHWGFLLSHYAIFETPTSELAQAIFISFFLHGCAVFGVEPIFHNT